MRRPIWRQGEGNRDEREYKYEPGTNSRFDFSAQNLMSEQHLFVWFGNTEQYFVSLNVIYLQM